MLVPLLFQVRAEILVDTESGKIVDYILDPDDPLFFTVGRLEDLSDDPHYELIGHQLIPACPQVKLAKAQAGPISVEEADRAIRIALDTDAQIADPHICIGEWNVS
jgi:hypothetical protein